MAAFFSYIGPEDRMDTGLTKHSGCPVLEGEKWLCTMWMRKGVSLERPSSALDASGNEKIDPNS
jgi:hypothetical protein